jgi:hypothetical protein
MKKSKTVKPETAEFTKQVGQALKRALRRARATAKMHGTKLYFSRDGKIVAEKP